MHNIISQNMDIKEARNRLDSLFLSGFKSFDEEGQTINFGDITVLLGANGSGKSCVASFFKMLNFMMNGDLQTFIGIVGSASHLLHYGPEFTEKIQFRCNFSQGEQRRTEYEVFLTYAMPDRLIFSGEHVKYHAASNIRRDSPQEYYLDVGGGESKLIDDTKTTSTVLLSTLRRIRFYHFHDTSGTAYIKRNPYIDNNRYLQSNAGNLASFLRAMKISEDRQYYDRIVRHIQAVFPQFKDFDLEPSQGNPNFTRLMWKDISGQNYRFDPNQMSDGSLRFMALASLLLQPPSSLPSVIVMDEPELGLHPAAIHDLADMVKTAATHSQIILATQSSQLVDEFDDANVTILEWNKSYSRTEVKSFSEEQLADWLKDYTMSELWEKNVLGGLP